MLADTGTPAAAKLSIARMADSKLPCTPRSASCVASRPSTETDVPGFLLAGDWIDTGLPATIESAVRSGHRAADLAAHR